MEEESDREVQRMSESLIGPQRVVVGSEREFQSARERNTCKEKSDTGDLSRI